MLRRVWEHFILNEPIGTRPLEEVLQRLQKNGHLPRKQAAYAVAVKELGNVGTHVHDEKVDKADVVQVLSPLISVLEWYFEQEWAVGAVSVNRGGQTPTPAPNRDREPIVPVSEPVRRPRYFLPLAVGFAVMLMVTIVAGLFVVFRGRTVQPIAETVPRSDQERIQGRWQMVEVEGASSKSHSFNEVVWTFRGTQLTDSGLVDGREFKNQGPFSLSQGVEGKLFDFTTTRPDGAPIVFKGIYEFEGEFLKVCYWYGPRDLANSPAFRRPNSFVVGAVTRRNYIKFRRVGE